MGKKEQIEPPKVFISYSWTTPEHEDWVLRLAKDLCEYGVDTVLDKWSLREGANQYEFMERMVTDPSVRKVIVVCDRMYQEKADRREGGVGTETQIISPEIYEQVDSTNQKQKFVAVITEKDEDGQPYVPAFLKGRIYIDMSDIENHSESFEKLIRWVFDRPVYKRPDIGEPPAYIFDESPLNLRTSSRFQRAISAVRRQEPFALSAIRDYFDTLLENLDSMIIEPDPERELDDQVVESIESFLPYRDEIIDLISAIARYRDDETSYEEITRLFEKFLPYKFYFLQNVHSRYQLENYNFILYELALYTATVFLSNQKFAQIDYLLSQGYYLPSSPSTPGKTLDFNYFSDSFDLLKKRWTRLGENYRDPALPLLEKRMSRRDVDFNHLLQTEFIIVLRDFIQTDSWDVWSQHTFHSGNFYFQNYPFEFFERSSSARFFQKFQLALGITHKEQIEDAIRKAKERWRTDYHRRTDLRELTNIDQLATKP